MKNVVIYDNRCVYCNKFKSITKRLDKKNKIRFIPYSSVISQNILNKQFGKRKGFALYLFTNKKVYTGKFAIKKILGMLNLKKVNFLYKLYPITVKIVSHLTRRKTRVQEPKGSRKLKKEVIILLKKV